MKEEDLLCTVYSFSYFEAVAKDMSLISQRLVILT